MQSSCRSVPRPSGALVVLVVLVLQVASRSQVDLLYSQSDGGGPLYFFGRQMADLGDVDGDGINDLAVNNSAVDPPWIRILSGANGYTIRNVLGTAWGAEFGRAIAAPGDIDGDFVPDLVVGEPGSSAVGFQHGSVHAYSGFTGALIWSFHGNESDARLGHSLCVIGDVDGDGIPDLAAGIPRQDSPSDVDAGGIFVLSGIDGSLIRAITGGTANGVLGWSCAAIGDVDLDGIGDFVAGALYDDSPTATATGAAYVFSGLTGSLLHQSHGATPLARHGFAVSGAGDVDGDGVPDYMVSAPWEDSPGGTLDAGLVEIRSGATFALIGSITGGPTNRLVGTSLAAYGDLDADGQDDVLVGAAAGQTFAAGGTGGSVRLHLGSDGSIHFEVLGVPGDLEFGSSLAAPGDLDGDGVVDLVIGTPGNGTYQDGHIDAYRVLPTQVLGGGQANGPAATLLVDDVEPGPGAGPFVTYLKSGQSHALVVKGAPDAFFAIYGSALLNPGGYLIPGFGSVDIGTGPSFLDVMVLVDGFAPILPIYAIDLGGSARIEFAIPAGWPTGVFVNVQALVQNAQPWQGGIWSSLSAAHRLVIR